MVIIKTTIFFIKIQFSQVKKSVLITNTRNYMKTHSSTQPALPAGANPSAILAAITAKPCRQSCAYGLTLNFKRKLPVGNIYTTTHM